MSSTLTHVPAGCTLSVMTTAIESPPRAARDQSVGLCVAVAAAVVLGWVLYRHYVFVHASERVFGWPALSRWLWLAELVQALLVSSPYALALLLWGRDLARGLGGAAVALGAGVYVAALDYAFQTYVSGHNGEALSNTTLRVYDWAIVLGEAVLVPLAWGVARRRGRRAWALGLVVGPVVAAVLHELQLHSTWWQLHVVFTQGAGAWMLLAVVYVVPFVAAALTCWAIGSRHGVVRPRTP